MALDVRESKVVEETGLLEEELLQRKRAEEALWESKEQYRTLFEQSRDAVYITSRDGRIVDINDSMLELFGYTREEFMGLKAQDTYVDPAQRRRYQREIEKKGGVRDYEVRLRKKDGTEIECLVTATVRRAQDGSAVGYQGIIRDITERKRAEERLRCSLEETARSQRLLLALSQAGEMVQRARTPDEVYRTIGDEITRLGYHAGIFILTDDQSHLTVSHLTFESVPLRAAEKLTGLSAQNYRFPLVAGGFYHQIIVEGETTFTEPMARHMAEALPVPVRPLATRVAALLGLEQSILAPLRVDDETYGLLTVSGRDLTEADVPAITAFATQAAIAIENARLHEQARQRTSELSTLDLVGLTLASTRDLLSVLDLIVESSQQLTGTPGVHIFLYDEIAGEFTHGAGRWDLQQKEPALRMPRSGGVSDTVAKRGKPLVINDARNHPLYSSPEAQSWGINAVAGFPLKGAEALLGILYVAFFTPHAFVEDELKVLSVLANLATAAIENAQAYEKLKSQNLETISALAAAVEAKDPYTSGHSEKVTHFAMAIAEKMGLSHDEIENLQVAALLHDIGKIGIPDSVLNKPARLTSAEFLMIKAHPVIAAEIVGKIEALAHLVPVIRHHHERYDGTGYPDGLKGDDIPLLARILSVADGFEAMTSERPYRFAKSQEEAIKELKAGAGTQWDPRMVEVFVKMYDGGMIS